MQNLAKALLIVTPKNDIRCYLNGAFFEADGLSVVTTDGKQLLHIALTEAAHECLRGKIVSNDTLKAIAATNCNILKPHTCSLEVLAGFGIVPKFIEGTFPQFSRIADFTTDFNNLKAWGHERAFNPAFLVNALKVAKLVTPHKLPALTIRQSADCNDANIHIQIGKMRMIVCPMHASHS